MTRSLRAFGLAGSLTGFASLGAAASAAGSVRATAAPVVVVVPEPESAETSAGQEFLRRLRVELATAGLVVTRDVAADGRSSSAMVRVDLVDQGAGPSRRLEAIVATTARGSLPSERRRVGAPVDARGSAPATLALRVTEAIRARLSAAPPRAVPAASGAPERSSFFAGLGGGLSRGLSGGDVGTAAVASAGWRPTRGWSAELALIGSLTRFSASAAGGRAISRHGLVVLDVGRSWTISGGITVTPALVVGAAGTSTAGEAVAPNRDASDVVGSLVVGAALAASVPIGARAELGLGARALTLQPRPAAKIVAQTVGHASWVIPVSFLMVRVRL